MKWIRGILKFSLILIILLGVVLGVTHGRVFIDGYSTYKEVIEEHSIEQKVEELRTRDTYVTIDEISPYFIEAIVAIEDHRFDSHNGIDFIGLARAIITNIISGEVVQGGSTITQQLAKNMYFNSEQTMLRKVAELFVALDLEKIYSKEEILEIYVNLIYFGRSCYGIEQASQKFFYKPAVELTLEESAYLAGMPQAPTLYSQNHELATQRQQVVLEAMNQNIE